MNSSTLDMRRAAPRLFVPSARLKAAHERAGRPGSLKAFAKSASAQGDAGAATWLANKRSPPLGASPPSPRGQPRWAHDGRSRLALNAPGTSPSGHVAQGTMFSAG